MKTMKPGDVLCIIPDKVLHRLPFAALISPHNGKYLIEDYALFYAPSLSVLWHTSEAAQRKSSSGQSSSGQGTALSIGNPSFDLNPHPELPLLRSAEMEARMVAELYEPSAKLRLARDASKDRILREMSSAEVIHFAGHYVIDGSSPLMSRMLLAGGDISALEIVSQRLDRTKLVVLSACQTGFDRYYESEGAVGLARAFIVAGVPLVVASQWPVDSDATASLMISFHRYRRSGLDSFESLRKAQADMLHASAEPHTSPYYWAAFLCAGGYVEY